MHTLRRVPTSFILILTIAFAALSLMGQGHDSPSAAKRDVMALFRDYPLVDFDPARHLKPGDDKRKTKSIRHDKKNLSESEAKLFRFQENTNAVSLMVPTAHSPVEEPLPVNQSEAVVIGKVEDAQAFLSNDKTNVYSEFTVKIEEVLKNSSPAPILVGDSITAERPGGRVRLPSGKVILIGDMGKSMPLPGRRYLLFLKHDQEVQTHTIVTGYELQGGRVSPLDGNRRFKEGQKYPQLVPYDRFEGVSEVNLLGEVRGGIARSTSNTP